LTGSDSSQQAELKSRQRLVILTDLPLRVVDDEGDDVPANGLIQGEVVLRGDNVILGYYRDPVATEVASIDGPGGARFRTGDIGVVHPDNYLELRDRAKDVIISSGENIASIEVEQVIDSHPDVLESAVVAAPHDVWGEVPVAFVTTRPDATITQGDLIDYVKVPTFKAPKQIHFGELTKTSTGKIQKFVLQASLQRQPEPE